MVKIVGISGSLRQASYNTATLHSLQKLAPQNFTIDIFDIAPIPLYNDDVREAGMPAAVEDLCNRIKNADGVVIVTPEYNYSIPGVLKNAIDWVSRSSLQPFNGKPVGIMGASMGMLGTARAQYHLRQCFVFLNAYVMNRPEVMIGTAQNKFDKDGNLMDEKTAEVITAFLEEFMVLAGKFGG